MNIFNRSVCVSVAFSGLLLSAPAFATGETLNETAPVLSGRTKKAIRMELEVAYGDKIKSRPVLTTNSGEPAVMSVLDDDGNGFEISVTPDLQKAAAPNKKKLAPTLLLMGSIREVSRHRFLPYKDFTFVSRLGKAAQMTEKDEGGKLVSITVKSSLVTVPIED